MEVKIMTRKANDKGGKDLKNCFAYKNRRCLILKSKNCYDCPFYKTREEYKEDRRKALDRLNTLDKEYKTYIMEKYYSNKWMR
jgi:hypothetical protein